MEKKATELFWKKLVEVYFNFYKKKFRDQDGYQLSPDWSPQKRGMEAKGLKGIITRLRNIAEEKNIEWTEEYACSSLLKFLEKAYNNPFYKKTFLCCILNKFKDQIIISEELNNELVKKILEVWYFNFPNYVRVFENDQSSCERIIFFLKEQYKNASIIFSDESVLSTINVLINFIQRDEFWKNKSLKSIANNIQGLIIQIKDKNETDKTFSREGFADEFERRYKSKQ